MIDYYIPPLPPVNHCTTTLTLSELGLARANFVNSNEASEQALCAVAVTESSPSALPAPRDRWFDRSLLPSDLSYGFK
ncbi:predicted protein [Arabidopsis lyrata subsp. lyrata]|uniref:Predicted protein n=1 Tax=Arabidopsis lyrata subsp. lyrata TaxID=81972 RepID=D7LN06_ARALL|nr:predicted protein [Arabidopsis lyrata subsp. lyrata]